MKIALAYLQSSVWFVGFCAAAYYGWGQGVEGVRNVVYVLLAVQLMLIVFLMALSVAVLWFETSGKTFKRPDPIVHRTSAAWATWRILILSFVFAWFGALFVAIAMPLLTAVGHLARVFFNTTVADSGE